MGQEAFMQLMRERASSHKPKPRPPKLPSHPVMGKPLDLPVQPVSTPMEAVPAATALYPQQPAANAMRIQRAPSAPSPPRVAPRVRHPALPSAGVVRNPPAPSPPAVPAALETVGPEAEIGPGALSPAELRSLFNDRRHDVTSRRLALLSVP